MRKSHWVAGVGLVLTTLSTPAHAYSDDFWCQPVIQRMLCRDSVICHDELDAEFGCDIPPPGSEPTGDTDLGPEDTDSMAGDTGLAAQDTDPAFEDTGLFTGDTFDTSTPETGVFEDTGLFTGDTFDTSTPENGVFVDTGLFTGDTFDTSTPETGVFVDTGLFTGDTFDTSTPETGLRIDTSVPTEPGLADTDRWDTDLLGGLAPGDTDAPVGAPSDTDGADTDLSLVGAGWGTADTDAADDPGALPGCAADSDGDSVCDADELCPGADDLADADADGVPDCLDVCVGDDASGDTDGDGVCDDRDACPADATNDGDGDGVCDSLDSCEGDDATGDSDQDGLCDDIDFVLAANHVRRGSWTVFTVDHAPPRAQVYVLASFFGTGRGPCLPRSGLCLDLRLPFVVAHGVADAQGSAGLPVYVPRFVRVLLGIQFEAVWTDSQGASADSSNVISRTLLP